MNEFLDESDTLTCPECGDEQFQSILLDDNCSCVCTACGARYPHPDVASDIPSGLKWISPEIFPDYYLGMTVFGKFRDGTVRRVCRSLYFDSKVWAEELTCEPISVEDEPIEWATDKRYFWKMVDKSTYQVCDLTLNREICVVSEYGGSGDALFRIMHITSTLNLSANTWLGEAMSLQD